MLSQNRFKERKASLPGLIRQSIPLRKDGCADQVRAWRRL